MASLPPLPPLPHIPRPVQAFRQGIRDLGYVEGQSIFIEFRWAEGKLERLPELAADLVRAKVDLIVAVQDAAIRAAVSATGTIPIVMAVSGDAVGAGFIASLAHPGGNVTGMTAIGPDLSAKRLQVLKELLPEISRVSIVWSPADPVHAFDWKHAQGAGATLGVMLHSVPVGKAEDFDGALAGLGSTQSEALVVFHNALTRSQRERILDYTRKMRVPAMYDAAEWVDAGGLISYGVTHADLFRQSARHVDKILKGAKPRDLPVEQPTRLELVINLKTAKVLGIAVPSTILVRADRVIE